MDSAIYPDASSRDTIIDTLAPNIAIFIKTYSTLE